MAITFNCEHCGKSLTTSDDKAGRQAKCPGCGEVITVPGLEASGADEFGADSFDSGESPSRNGGPTRSARRKTCPMCGEENAFSAKTCTTCGERFPTPRPLRTGGSESLELGDMMSTAWELLKENMAVTVVSTFLVTIPVVIGIYAAVVAVFSLVAFLDQHEEVVLVIAAVAAPIALVCVVVLAFLGPGQVKILLAAARGEELRLGMLFSGGPFFLRYLVASTIFFVGLGMATAACIVPGVLLFLMWWPYAYVLIEEDASAWSSLQRSRELMEGRWVKVFLIVLAGGAINYVASTFCCVAGLFSQTFLNLLLAATYVRLNLSPAGNEPTDDESF